MKILDSLSFTWLVPIALILAVLPVHPQPHLIEKLTMLFQNNLTKPIDIFDLVLHGAPLLVLSMKIVYSLHKRIVRNRPDVKDES